MCNSCDVADGLVSNQCIEYYSRLCHIMRFESYIKWTITNISEKENLSRNQVLPSMELSVLTGRSLVFATFI
jgi:hypothetical protein